VTSAPEVLATNDPRQYDGLAGAWADPYGELGMLHWLAVSRAELIPPPPQPGAVLVDIACGGGLLAAPVAALGYRHVGVDIGYETTRSARRNGIEALRGDVLQLPLADASADVVVAGEVLEHVADPWRLVAEVCRVLRPGGTVVIDTIAATRIGRFVAVTLAERIPGGPPHGIHDPGLFIDRTTLVSEFARHGVELTISGLFPHPLDYALWMARRRPIVRMLRVPSTSVLFSGVGVKAG
jgi:2-polyprenyl-6-hydroxyphenyl methylase/3-demethylubiquinone-9 3-methyltransferase